METAAFEKGATHAQRLMAKTQKQFEVTARKIAGVGKTMTLAITAPLVGFGALAIKEANESAAAMAQVNAALASMGAVSGRTAAQLKTAADQMEMHSLFEGDEILTKVTANLLTFGNVAGEVFDRAQQAAIDMATRLGSDPQSAAIALGKALNDPVKGITALTRVGIQFTAQQKAQIKAMVENGQMARAQGIILAEVERQFRGSAQAAADTDPMHKATVAYKQMAETIGNSLLPIIPIFTDAIVSVASAFSKLSPETQKWVIIGAGLAAVLGPVLIGIGGLVSVLGVLLPALVPVAAGFVALATAIVTSVIPAMAALVVSLLPILIPLAAIGLAIGAVYMAWKHWDKIKPILVALYNAVKTYLLDKLNEIWNGVKQKIEMVRQLFSGLYDAVVGNSYIPDMVDGIGQHMARLDALMVAPVTAATSKTAEAFRALQTTVAGILDQLFPAEARHNKFVSELQALSDYAKQAKMPVEQLTEALKRLKDQYLDDALGEKEGISVLNAPPPELAERWEDSLDRIRSAGTNALGGLSEASKDLARDLNDVVTHGLKGLMRGFGSLKDIALNVLYTIGDAIIDNLSNKMSGAGGTGGIGGAIASILGSLLGGGKGGSKVIGMASGGSGIFGGRSGTDRNLLSLNGSPVARVTRGERFSVGANKGEGGAIIINQTFAPNLAGNAATKEEMIRFGALVKQDTMNTMRDFQRRR